MRRARRAGVDVMFRHVKAHSGDRRNEKCDAIARGHAGLPASCRGAGTPGNRPAGRRGPEAMKGRSKRDG